ncbi:MAG: hypothetical protein ACLQU1_21175 [Bryobacteraceae bacterium]
MRYWGYFAGKLVAAAGVLWGLLAVLNWYWPPEPRFWWDSRHSYIPPRFGYDLGYTAASLAWFLLLTGALYLVILDQRYRCRVCLRKLRMPVETGSWSRMLQFGRPRIEYICPYGHGTLREEELQISGLQNPEWTPHSDDIWEELCASSKEAGPES